MGAYGDNEHDDTEAIQKAVNICLNNTIKNTCYIPEGTYYITSPIRTATITTTTGNAHTTGLNLEGTTKTTITRKNRVLPSTEPAELAEQACLAIYSNHNYINNIRFISSPVGIYLGQDPRRTGEKKTTSVCFNNIEHIICNGVGTGIAMCAGHSVYYNIIKDFCITNSGVGIDMHQNFAGETSSFSQAGVANRNTFCNGEIDMCRAGIVNFTGDTNTFDTIHCEGITSTLGGFNKPEWLDTNNVAFYIKYQDNIVTNCVCEGCTIDLKDNGYGNSYINNTFDVYNKKVKINTPTSLGYYLGRYAGGTCTFTKLPGYDYASDLDVLPSEDPTWTHNISSPIRLKASIFSDNYSLKRYSLNSNIIDYDTVIQKLQGGENFEQGQTDNYYYHIKIGQINYVWIKTCFLVKEGQESAIIKIKLPKKPQLNFINWANRAGQKYSCYVQGTNSYCYLRTVTIDEETFGAIWIPHASGKTWSSTEGTFNEFDICLTYI